MAVLPFDVKYEFSSPNEILSEFLTLDLVSAGARGVLGPMEAAQLFRHAKDPLPPEVDSYWAKEIGKRLGVDAVIFGYVSQIPIVSSAAGNQPTILLDVAVFLMDVKGNLLRWTYVTNEEVREEDVTARLSEYATAMTESLLADSRVALLSSKRGCWRAPASVAREEPVAAKSRPTPKPTPKPQPPLTEAQKMMVKALRSTVGLTLPANLFNLRTTDLTKEGAIQLRDLGAALMSAEAPKSVEIAGHLDSTDDAADDLRLSKERAERVQKYLIDWGIDPSRMKAVGYGANQPLVPNLNQRSRLVNRRIEVLPPSAPAR
jgi:outer membrane protein OmpA-like peptidoglycan-associated protein